MESQPQNPEFRINPKNFHPCMCSCAYFLLLRVSQQLSSGQCSASTWRDSQGQRR